jgi:hypothetical protein
MEAVVSTDTLLKVVMAIVGIPILTIAVFRGHGWRRGPD